MRAVNDADVLERLEERGLELPSPPEPVASYIPLTRSGSIAFVAGQVPMEDGKIVHPGKLGASVSLEMGQEAAGRAALQALAVLRQHLGGSLERLTRILHLSVFVAAEPDFVEHAKVANGASDLLVGVLGPEGRHARVTVGVASLPLGSSVEVSMTAEVR
jgi:enamine deaminase RidA (YjgF/YER057c/UK114 family)